MRVIVSTEVQDNFNNYVVVDSLEKCLQLTGVDVLVIHKVKDDTFKAGVAISQLHKSGVKTFIYIAEDPIAIIRMAIRGVGGYYYEDEFYLEDEDELNALLDEINGTDGTGTELATTSTAIISDFIQAFARGDEKIKAPVYLQQVDQACTELCNITQKQEIQIKTMGSSAIEVFERASNIIKSMDDQRKLIEKQLDELANSQTAVAQSKPSLDNAVNAFSPFHYNSSAKVLLVRELSPCRYLTSFLLAYTQYIKYTLNKRVKLIFIVQRGAGVLSKYNNYPKITEQPTAYDNTLYGADIVVTNCPKRDVMKKLTSTGMDMYIIVDRLYGVKDIVTGRCTKVNAVSGFSDLARYNVKADTCIFPITSVKGEFFCIPSIKGFPTDVDARYMAYGKVCEEGYKKLDKLSGIVK